MGVVDCSYVLANINPDIIYGTMMPKELVPEREKKLSAALDGMTVLFTGVSYRFKRDEIKDFLVRHGARYVSSVTGKLDSLIVGDNPGQNKVDKAKSLGVPIVAERDFYAAHGLQ